MNYLHNYIKFFEDRNADGKNICFADPDIDHNDMYPVEGKIKDLFKLIGFPVTLGLHSNVVEPPNHDVVITNRHYRLKFNTDVNSQSYSIANILTRADLVPFCGGSIHEPFKFKERSYITEKWGNNNTFFQELTVSIAKYNPIKESLNFKGYHGWFNASSSEEAYQNVISFLNKEFENLCDDVYTTGFGSVTIPNLAFVIKEMINANSTPPKSTLSDYNSEIIIPDSIIKPLNDSINRLPDPYKTWNEIQKENNLLYSRIKNNGTDQAAIMGEMGF